MSYHPKRRRRIEDQHVDDWLMTYADMITLLLCFFAIFLSVSIPKKEQFEQARQKVMEKFAAPEDVLAGKFPPKPATPKAAETRDPFDKLPSFIDKYQGMKDVEVRPGDRIVTIAIGSAPLFAIGSADLSGEGRKILADVAGIAKDRHYADYSVTVEGHTDDSPIRTAQFPSNWELSTARAAAVVRFFLEQGVRADRLRASGYADVFPKAPNRDAAGKPIPENQALNRRVVIKMEKRENAPEEN